MEQLLYRNDFDFGIELKTKKEHKILHCLFSERIIFIENKITNEIIRIYPENDYEIAKMIIIGEFHDNMRDLSKVIIPKEATPCNHDFTFDDLKKFIFIFFENDVCRKFISKYHDYSFVENVEGYFIKDFNVKNEILYYFLEQAKLKNKKYNRELLHIILSLSMLNNKLEDNDFKKLINLSLDHFDYDDVLCTSIYDIDIDYCLNRMLLEIDKTNFTIEWNDIIDYIFNDLLKQSYNQNSYLVFYYYLEYLYKQIILYKEIKSMKTDFLYSDIVKLNKLLFDLKLKQNRGGL